MCREARRRLVLWVMMLSWRRAGQAAALHANQISRLRGLFVHWHRWLLKTRTLSSSLPLPSLTHIHRKQQTPWFPSIHPSPFSSLSWLFLALCHSSLFVLVSAWLHVRSFQTPSICFVLSVFCLQLTARKRMDLLDRCVAVRSRGSF